MKNPFTRKKSISQKITSSVPFTGSDRHDKLLKVIQQLFVYLAIFMAGYIVGLVQSIL